MAKTEAELEAIHMARAAAKGLGQGQGHPTEPVVMDGQDDDAYVEDEQVSTGNEELLDQIAHLQQQLAATQGRVVPEQRRADEFRQYYETERQARERETRERDEQIAALKEQLEESSAQSSLDELLTPEEREYMDPTQLAIFTKIADAAAKRRAPRVNVKAEALAALAEREAQAVEEHRTEVLTDPSRGVSSLSVLAHDPAFQAWLAKEENDDFDLQVNSMLQARSVKEIDQRARAVARRIAKFKEQSKTRTPATSRPTDPRQSLTAAMQRRPQKVTDVEMNSKLAEATRLSRSRNPADRAKAKALLDSI